MNCVRAFANQLMVYEHLRDITRPGALLTALLDKGENDVRGFSIEVNGRMHTRGLDSCGSYRCRHFLAYFLPEQMAQRREGFILMSDSALGVSNASTKIAYEG